MVITPFTSHKKPEFLTNKFEMEYIIFAVVCYVFMIVTVVLPHASESYGTAKTYFQILIPLVVLFPIGGIVISKYLKLRPSWFLLAALIPFYLSTTGVTYQLLGSPRAITLSSEGELYTGMYISDAESNSARWLKNHGKEGEVTHVYDLTRDILLSQGGITHDETRADLVALCEEGKPFGGYVYLRWRDISDYKFGEKYPYVFNEKDEIYTNGKSQIYR